MRNWETFANPVTITDHRDYFSGVANIIALFKYGSKKYIDIFW